MESGRPVRAARVVQDYSQLNKIGLEKEQIRVNSKVTGNKGRRKSKTPRWVPRVGVNQLNW